MEKVTQDGAVWCRYSFNDFFFFLVVGNYFSWVYIYFHTDQFLAKERKSSPYNSVHVDSRNMTSYIDWCKILQYIGLHKFLFR